MADPQNLGGTKNEALVFKHPNLQPLGKAKGDPLTVITAANSIYWSYSLNTQTIPTYAGEVIQILSCYINDITIEGDCVDYRQMEQIYNYFVQYLYSATQPGQFNPEPIRMLVPSRHWDIPIIVKEVPGLRLATDLVAPSYQIQAQILEDDNDPNFGGALFSSILDQYSGRNSANSDNPALDPSITTSLAQLNIDPALSYFSNPLLPGNVDSKANIERAFKIGHNEFSGIINNYLQGDFTNLTSGFGLFSTANASGPTPALP